LGIKKAEGLKGLREDTAFMFSFNYEPRMTLDNTINVTRCGIVVLNVWMLILPGK
jgi:hypothetical protein